MPLKRKMMIAPTSFVPNKITILLKDSNVLMKILTVRENNNKVNDLFVASDFSILTVEEALNRIDEFKNCRSSQT